MPRAALCSRLSGNKLDSSVSVILLLGVQVAQDSGFSAEFTNQEWEAHEVKDMEELSGDVLDARVQQASQSGKIFYKFTKEYWENQLTDCTEDLQLRRPANVEVHVWGPAFVQG